MLECSRRQEKNVGEAPFCCAGYFSAGGRGSLLEHLESLHVEFIKCLGQLKMCKCCPQHCRQGDARPRTQEATKEAQVFIVDMDKGPKENIWTVKEKK
jgi:hypothetical protein